VPEPLPAAKPALRRLAERLTPAARAGDYAQAVMDLGATLCLPRRPRCLLCPWESVCAARAGGDPESYPARTPKGAKPQRHGVAFWAVRRDGAVLLRRRPPRGLLGGMMEVPSTEWRSAPWSLAEARRSAPVPARWRALDGYVRHGFTHFDLELRVLVGTAAEGDGLWWPVDRLGEQALPSLMKKVVRHALAKA